MLSIGLLGWGENHVLLCLFLMEKRLKVFEKNFKYKQNELLISYYLFAISREFIFRSISLNPVSICN